MTAILYTFDRVFMRKTYEAVDRHVTAESAYLGLDAAVEGCSDELDEVSLDGRTVDEVVAAVNPDVVVRNHRLNPGEFAFDDERTIVHLRHGASVGRGEIDTTIEHLGDVVDVALAPGERWADRYREGFPDDVVVGVVGIPEADALVESEAPRERRVLYAPTNHNYGEGSYLETADAVLDTFADSKFGLRFRPHPMDRIEEPGRSLTERCRERIADMDNVTFDERATPLASMSRADLLVSDCSGIVAEWLHTDRPLVQLDALAGEREVPRIGTVTDTPTIELVADLYEHGPPPDVERRRERFRAELGIPTDGRASERAAAALESCTG
jgi:hypothetical protein